MLQFEYKDLSEEFKNKAILHRAKEEGFIIGIGKNGNGRRLWRISDNIKCKDTKVNTKKMLQEIIRKEIQEELIEERHGLGHEHDNVKKIRACPYYSPFKASCVNHNHLGYDEEYPNKYPRCNIRGKYSECKIVDKVIELTLDENNSVIHREYLYVKGRVNLFELGDTLKQDA